MFEKTMVLDASIAFGMGIENRNIREIIHFNMPKSIESHVQEFGRDVREDLVSHCHLIF
jgi:superfamily II DNA helicase RecQ